MALALFAGFSLLNMPEPTKTPSWYKNGGERCTLQHTKGDIRTMPSCIIIAASAGVAIPPAEKLKVRMRNRKKHNMSYQQSLRLASDQVLLSSRPTR